MIRQLRRTSEPSDGDGDGDGGGDPGDAGTSTRESDRSVVASPAFRLGRALFGGILAFMAVDNLRNLDERVEYADSKGAPRPDLSVPGASAGLLLGSAGITTWRLPSLSATAVGGFLAGVTPVMHDFWNRDDDQQRQQQLTHFMKNAALLGAALLVLRLGRREG